MRKIRPAGEAAGTKYPQMRRSRKRRLSLTRKELEAIKRDAFYENEDAKEIKRVFTELAKK